MRDQTRVDTIYQTLRDRICLGDYKPGDVFHENELGREFEVSRTPIRQVLQRLAFEKLAVVRPGVGTIVEDFSRREAGKFLEVQARLLNAAADLEMTAIEGDIEENIANLQVRAQMLPGGEGGERFWNFFRTMHALVSELMQNDSMRQINELLFYRSAQAMMDSARSDPALASETIRRHVPKLVEAMDDSDPARFLNEAGDLLRSYRTLFTG